MTDVNALALADRLQLGKVPYLLGSLDAVIDSGVRPLPVVSTLDGTMPRWTRFGRTRLPEGLFRVVDEAALGAVRAVVTDAVSTMDGRTLGLNLFEVRDTKEIERVKLDVVDTLLTLLSVGAGAGPEVDGPGGIDIDAIMHVSFGAELLTRTARGAILGRDLPFDIPDDILTRLDKLEQAGCYDAIRGAATGYADARDAAAPLPVGVIQKLDPVDACAGEKLVISGSGFGKSGMVAFTTTSGVVLVPATTWADDQVEVTVPPTAVAGPLGLYPPGDKQASESLGTATGELIDALGNCFGPGVGARLDSARVTLNTAPLLVTTGAYFRGGAPVIKSFLADGLKTLACRPSQKVTLSWEVPSAKSLKLTPTGGAPAPTSTPKLDAAGKGSLQVKMPRGTWTFGYNLEATNKCATTTPAKVTISVKDKIAFALSGGGSRGDFQLGALRYLADKGIKPNALTTTSVGSINGLQLAHGDQVAGTAQSTLENIWFTKMRTCKDMFDLSAVSLAIRTAIENALPNAVGSAAAGAGIGGGVGLVLLGPVGLIIGLLSGSIGGSAAGVQQAINNVLPLIDVIMTDGPDATIGGVTMERSGMYTFAPLRATMVAQVMPNAGRNVGHRVAHDVGRARRRCTRRRRREGQGVEGRARPAPAEERRVGDARRRCDRIVGHAVADPAREGRLAHVRRRRRARGHPGRDRGRRPGGVDRLRDHVLRRRFTTRESDGDVDALGVRPRRHGDPVHGDQRRRRDAARRLARRRRRRSSFARRSTCTTRWSSSPGSSASRSTTAGCAPPTCSTVLPATTPARASRVTASSGPARRRGSSSITSTGRSTRTRSATRSVTCSTAARSSRRLISGRRCPPPRPCVRSRSRCATRCAIVSP